MCWLCGPELLFWAGLPPLKNMIKELFYTFLGALKYGSNVCPFWAHLLETKRIDGWHITTCHAQYFLLVYSKSPGGGVGVLKIFWVNLNYLKQGGRSLTIFRKIYYHSQYQLGGKPNLSPFPKFKYRGMPKVYFTHWKVKQVNFAMFLTECKFTKNCDKSSLQLLFSWTSSCSGGKANNGDLL